MKFLARLTKEKVYSSNLMALALLFSIFHHYDILRKRLRCYVAQCNYRHRVSASQIRLPTLPDCTQPEGGQLKAR